MMEDEDEPQPTPAPRDIARAIVGGEPPQWLIRHFRHWAPTIMLERAFAAMRFKRSDARNWLTNVQRAAEVLQQSLEHEPARWLLETGDLGPIANLEDVLDQLADVEMRAQAGLNSAMLKTPDGSTPRGRGRPSPAEASGPKVVVAGMIALAFEYVHKRLPGDRNRAAWEAAECCWRYVKSMPAGNIPPEKAISRGEDRLTKWRTYFEAALSQNPILGTNHDEFERHLRIGEELARRSEAENEEDAPPAAKTAAAKREGRARRAQA